MWGLQGGSHPIGLEQGVWIIGFLYKSVSKQHKDHTHTLSDHFWQQQPAIKRALTQTKIDKLCVCVVGLSLQQQQQLYSKPPFCHRLNSHHHWLHLRAVGLDAP